MPQFTSVELLAPVGSFESLVSAVQAGADAIYFGVEHLNMRSRSSINFTLEDLSKISEIANSSGVMQKISLI